MSSEGSLLQARVCRKYKKKTDGKESTASTISAVIPLLEYDLYRQIIFKMKIVGVNACFGLNIQINLGSNMITAVATGTAVSLIDYLCIDLFNNHQKKKIFVFGLPIADPVHLSLDAPSFMEKYYYNRDQLVRVLNRPIKTRSI